jgi:hypothetical protein
VPQLRGCYAHILKAADIVCARPAARQQFLQLGVADSRLVPDPGFLTPATHFHPPVAPLDVDALLQRQDTRTIDPALPAIGVYGKMGPVKGTFDLLQPLATLKRRAVRFTLLAMTQGAPEDERRLADAITAENLCSAHFRAIWSPGSLECRTRTRFNTCRSAPAIAWSTSAPRLRSWGRWQTVRAASATSHGQSGTPPPTVSSASARARARSSPKDSSPFQPQNA